MTDQHRPMDRALTHDIKGLGIVCVFGLLRDSQGPVVGQLTADSPGTDRVRRIECRAMDKLRIFLGERGGDPLEAGLIGWFDWRNRSNIQCQFPIRFGVCRFHVEPGFSLSPEFHRHGP